MQQAGNRFGGSRSFKLTRLALIAAGVAAAAVTMISSATASPKQTATGTNQVPPQLAGQWAISWQGGTQYLILADSRFKFLFDYPFGQPPPMGAVSVSGNTITFYSAQYCNGTGTYQWSLSDGSLTFTQVATSNDPCPREAVLTSGTWTHRR
jgi:heat shock protein HslJ